MRVRLGLLLLLLPLLAGCIDGAVTARLLPDGSGEIEVDLGYDLAKWPPFLGDPLDGIADRKGLARWLSPGLVAWSEPRIVTVNGTRRLRTAVYFDDIEDVVIVGSSGGKRFDALSFDRAGERRLDLDCGFLDLLDRRLPLPSPQRVGMRDVAISPELLEGIRSQIGPVIVGLDVRLDVVFPGEVERFDGLDYVEGNVASLEIDADRLTRAFTTRSGELLDEAALLNGEPKWTWKDESVQAAEIEALKQRAAAAKAWWAVGN